MNYEAIRNTVLDLPDHRLRELYLEIATELNRRDGVTFRSEAAE